ncbi:hypothetical protein D5018_11585 [Parashewanella curva]|uniref:Uncharacterized protein n=1 Tax=Parashewanella curva TaxID=2338552 RepID=A0A3L8PVZ6_9GAMM|nr:hypothetical protein [Parashewanella curva]RLV59504.1 hypothetical protein D5018_11585 [Parashewanella curva]
MSASQIPSSSTTGVQWSEEATQNASVGGVNLPRILNDTMDASSQWDLLGIMLKIPSYKTANFADKYYHDTERCYSALLEHYFQSAEGTATNKINRFFELFRTGKDCGFLANGPIYTVVTKNMAADPTYYLKTSSPYTAVTASSHRPRTQEQLSTEIAQLKDLSSAKSVAQGYLDAYKRLQDTLKTTQQHHQQKLAEVNNVIQRQSSTIRDLQQKLSQSEQNNQVLKSHHSDGKVEIFKFEETIQRLTEENRQLKLHLQAQDLPPAKQVQPRLATSGLSQEQHRLVEHHALRLTTKSLPHAIKDVYNPLVEVSMLWRQIGTNLSITENDLESIDSMHRDPKSKLIAVINKANSGIAYVKSLGNGVQGFARGVYTALLLNGKQSEFTQISQEYEKLFSN